MPIPRAVTKPDDVDTTLDLPLVVEAGGSLRAVESTSISAPAIRNVWQYKIAFMAEQSAKVRKGQRILSFDPSDLVRKLQEKTAERDQAVDDLIALVVAVDSILQAQSAADAKYFCGIAGEDFDVGQRKRVEQGLLKAYRWQYIVSGAQHPRFQDVLGSLITEAQGERIGNALAPLVESIH